MDGYRITPLAVCVFSSLSSASMALLGHIFCQIRSHIWKYEKLLCHFVLTYLLECCWVRRLWTNLSAPWILKFGAPFSPIAPFLCHISVVIGFLAIFRTYLHAARWVVYACLYVVWDLTSDFCLVLFLVLFFFINIFHNLVNYLENFYEKIRKANHFLPNVFVLDNS